MKFICLLLVLVLIGGGFHGESIAVDVDRLVRSLSLAQQIGQMTLVWLLFRAPVTSCSFTPQCSQTENPGKANELHSRGFGQGAADLVKL